eukprot:5774036-Pyramimonas_sp.AAC.1
MLQGASVHYEGERMWHQRLIQGDGGGLDWRVIKWMVLLGAVVNDIYEEGYSRQGRDIAAV